MIIAGDGQLTDWRPYSNSPAGQKPMGARIWVNIGLSFSIFSLFAATFHDLLLKVERRLKDVYVTR